MPRPASDQVHDPTCGEPGDEHAGNGVNAGSGSSRQQAVARLPDATRLEKTKAGHEVFLTPGLLTYFKRLDPGWFVLGLVTGWSVDKKADAST